MDQLSLILPELILAGAALAVLVLDLVLPKGTPDQAKRSGETSRMVAMIGLLVAFTQTKFHQPSQAIFDRMLVVDGLTAFFRVLIFIGSFWVSALAGGFAGLSDRRRGPFFALLLMAALAMSLMAMSNDLVILFLSIEFLGLASYILVGFARHQLPSSEGAVKYFLVGAFSSALMLYGMSLLYGLVHSTNLYDVAAWYRAVPAGGYPTLLHAAIFFMLAGFGFKIAMVPFHMWVPDVYHGAPTPITAFLAVASKAAGMAVFLRVFLVALPFPVGVLTVLAGLTMTVGNLLAIPQKNLKRLLAYSSIGHAGYILMGLVASQAASRASGTFLKAGDMVTADFGLQGVLIYLIAYLVMNVGAFAVVIAISNKTGGEDLEHYTGLSKRNPGLAYLFIVFFLSLAGIPPTVGFLAKFYVIGAAVQAGLHGLALVAVLNSVIALYYYFRVVHQMFFVEPTGEGSNARLATLGPTLAITLVLVLGFGMFPEFLSRLVKDLPLVLLN